jgi:hypothetical protein
MRRVKSILKSGNRTLKVWESENKLRGEIYVDGNCVMAADFFGKEAEEFRVREYFGFDNYYRVPFERKNGKIILYPVNKMRRIIWTNNDYNEWHDAMSDEGYDEKSINPEEYFYWRNDELDDERCNLNITVDGCIIAFANLGLWNGRVNGAKVIGSNVSQILSSSDDYSTWFCDPYNVKYEGIHHDGTNYVIYRVARDREHAEELVDKIAYGGMSEEQFRKATSSLRPYIAKVYGW